MPTRCPAFLPAALLAIQFSGAALAGTPDNAFGSADLATAARLREAASRGSEAYALVSGLTTEVGPRLAGSAGDRAAVHWALARLQALGFANVHSQPVTVPLWVRGEASVHLDGDPDRPLSVASLGHSVGTPDEGLTAEVVSLADLKALAALPDGSLAGKIAYIGNRMERRRDGGGYGPAVAARADGPSVAATKGAVAFLLRSVGTDTNRLPHTGMTEYARGVTPIPALALASPDADLIERRLASGTVRATVHSSARHLEPVASANVIGELPGDGSLPGVVLLGAHLDSWDLGEGAIDDGAGVAIAIATAREIAKAGLHPRRTIRVVLFAQEEAGGLGAKAYAEDVLARHERHVAALEADSGGGRVYAFRHALAAGRDAEFAGLLEVLKPLGVVSEGSGAHGGADLRLLHEHGVPVFDLAQDSSAYFDVHHTANDTLAQLNAADLDQVVAAFAATTWLLANGPGFDPAPLPAPESH